MNTEKQSSKLINLVKREKSLLILLPLLGPKLGLFDGGVDIGL